VIYVKRKWLSPLPVILILIIALAWVTVPKPIVPYDQYPRIQRAMVDITMSFSFSFKTREGESEPIIMTTYGQGVAIAPHLILTARHVVVPPKEVYLFFVKVPIKVQTVWVEVLEKEVTQWGFYDTFSAEVIWYDEKVDVALLYVDRELPYFWNGIGKARLGETVFFADSRAAKSLALLKTEIVGIGFDGFDIEEDMGMLLFFKDKTFSNPDVIGTALPAVGGVSGGPLMNRKGEYVGVASFGAEVLYFAPLWKVEEAVIFLRNLYGWGDYCEGGY